MGHHEKDNPSPTTAMTNRAYLASRFGQEIFEDHGPHALPEGYQCLYPPPDYFCESTAQTKQVEAQIVSAVESARNRQRYCFSPISRRFFLKASSMAVATALLPACSPQGSGYTPVPNAASASENVQILLPDVYPAGSPRTNIDAYYTDGADHSVVGLAYQGSIEERVRTAIDLAGGLGEIEAGQTVCIKPNIVMKMFNLIIPGKIPPTVTNPEVLRHVIRAVVERTQDPSTVYVAERSAWMQSTLFQMVLSGIYKVAVEEGVNLLPWDKKPYIQFTLPKAEYLTMPVPIAESIRMFDHFINVPVLKNHEYPAEYTLCIKNFVGTVNADERWSKKYNLHDQFLGEKAAELNLCRPYITMNIADAGDIILTGGPCNGFNQTAQPEIVIASKDRVACDSVGVAVLKYHALKQGIRKNYTEKTVWQQRQIIHAGKLGLGYNDPSRIWIKKNTTDQTIQDIIRIWSETA